VWILCALSLVALLAVLNERLRAGGSPAGTVAVAVAAAGAAVDIFCDALWIGVLPDLAAQGPDRVFWPAERSWPWAARWPPTASTPAPCWCSRGCCRARRVGPARLLGWVTALAGFGLCGAGLHGQAHGVALFSGVTISAFVFWAIAGGAAWQAAP
jgi:hypothetical protein